MMRKWIQTAQKELGQAGTPQSDGDRVNAAATIPVTVLSYATFGPCGACLDRFKSDRLRKFRRKQRRRHTVADALTTV
jgi:hypothetical protein